MNTPAQPRTRKRFGQHFLHDPQVIERIIDAFNPRAGEKIVEIGPGRGALTGRLLAATGRLDVIELDRDLAAGLPDRFPDHGNLTVHGSDALRFDFTTLAQAPHELRIIGNLPYNISTPLIFHCLDHAAVIHDMLFMLQREVVQRMTAAPDSKTYGRLSVMTRFACEVESLFSVGAGAFQPPPKVDSAVVRLVPHRTPLFPDIDPAALDEIVRRAFSQRRKTLRNSLGAVLPAKAIQAAGIDPGQRAEQLNLAQFAALADALSSTYTNSPPVDNFVDK
ncbi:MAG: 16S rRNA (adenine(1518)-N(6)/adenine(1519)-N(6))-dimethyltransferase RsmA [Gammaproteobacteria bacterium]|nr:16S rRNA (adenine(1518)-N(6)/adenine(1519)-N(6))-dimethyltransferase RsmA [Gammaproteobacteria bacterium]